MTGASYTYTNLRNYVLTLFSVFFFFFIALVRPWCSTDILVIWLLLYPSLFDGRSAELCTKICYFHRSVGLRLWGNVSGGVWDAFSKSASRWCLRIWCLSGGCLLGSQEYVLNRIETTCSFRYNAIDMVGAIETWGSSRTTHLRVPDVQDSGKTWCPLHNRT